MKNLLSRFVREEDGQDLVEYAFLLAFIALVVAVSLDVLGINLNTFYDSIAQGIGGMQAPGVPVPGTD
jgi:Flp pilus assembly pilin Flp